MPGKTICPSARKAVGIKMNREGGRERKRNKEMKERSSGGES